MAEARFDPVRAGVAKVAARKGHIGACSSAHETPLPGKVTVGGLLMAMDGMRLDWDAPVEVRVRLDRRSGSWSGRITASSQSLSLSEEDGKLVVSMAVAVGSAMEGAGHGRAGKG